MTFISSIAVFVFQSRKLINISNFFNSRLSWLSLYQWMQLNRKIEANWRNNLKKNTQRASYSNSFQNQKIITFGLLVAKKRKKKKWKGVIIPTAHYTRFSTLYNILKTSTYFLCARRNKPSHYNTKDMSVSCSTL